MKALGVPYHFLSQPIIEQAKSSIKGDSLCAFCSRFKRGILYTCCQQNGYNKLVLAQHLDDLVESLFMSMLHNGQVSGGTTMMTKSLKAPTVYLDAGCGW